MRLFVGLAIDNAVKESLERLTLRLRAQKDGLRWSTPDQWHVTLVFLGEVDDASLDALAQELNAVRCPAMTLHMDSFGVFERAGIFYAQVEVSEELLALYEAVAAAVRRCGMEVEDRPYKAHITLARAKNRDGRDAIERLRRIAESREQRRVQTNWTAAEFLLYQSQLSPRGSLYVVRRRFTLQAGRTT